MKLASSMISGIRPRGVHGRTQPICVEQQEFMVLLSRHVLRMRTAKHIERHFLQRELLAWSFLDFAPDELQKIREVLNKRLQRGSPE
ncbi:hypothetical protein ACVWZ4_001691 [Bradyrhizobium sp. USDA 4472]